MIVGGWVLVAWHPLEPRHKPGQAEETKDEEKGTPAKPAHQDAPEEQAEGRSSIKAGDDYGIGETAPIFREVAGKYFGIRRVNDGFADSQNEPRGQQQREAACEPGSCRGPGPEEETGGQHPFDIDMVDKPSGRDLEDGIAPEKGREQDSKPQVR